MCCRNIKRYRNDVYPAIKGLLGDDMPELDIEDNDGVCIYLTDDNRCSIYEHRPVICNSDKMFDLLATALNISKTELWKAQVVSCGLNRKNRCKNIRIWKSKNLKRNR